MPSPQTAALYDLPVPFDLAAFGWAAFGWAAFGAGLLAAFGAAFGFGELPRLLSNIPIVFFAFGSGSVVQAEARKHAVQDGVTGCACFERRVQSEQDP